MISITSTDSLPDRTIMAPSLVSWASGDALRVTRFNQHTKNAECKHSSVPSSIQRKNWRARTHQAHARHTGTNMDRQPRKRKKFQMSLIRYSVAAYARVSFGERLTWHWTEVHHQIGSRTRRARDIQSRRRSQMPPQQQCCSCQATKYHYRF